MFRILFQTLAVEEYTGYPHLNFTKLKAKTFLDLCSLRVTDLGKNHNIEGFKAFQQYYSTICKL